jgi:signal peptidase II|tara:strand:+ start:7745 stop:8239 length:495 start_codon:yes stop_codon:yes gene_type:complete
MNLLMMFFRKIVHSWVFKDKYIFPVFSFVFISDQITKYAVYKNMSLGESIPAEGIIRITYARNTGMAFSLFENFGIILLILSLIIASILIIYLFTIDKPRIVIRVFSGLVVAGALGNILDRIRFGYVNDFIDVGWWPIFNIADSSITIAIGIYIFDAIFIQKLK